MAHEMSLMEPKLGEMIAFRNIVKQIPEESAVDEASIEAEIKRCGYESQYVPEARVYNKGPQTIRDYVRQRRRIHSGHLYLQNTTGYQVSTMSSIKLFKLVVRSIKPNWKRSFWIPVARWAKPPLSCSPGRSFSRPCSGVISSLTVRPNSVWPFRIICTRSPPRSPVSRSRYCTPRQPCCSARRRMQPNIVFIMTDDHASHALSCYGSKINNTPNLDRIATEGMRFNNSFCTNSICAPCRAVILTGKYSRGVPPGSRMSLPGFQWLREEILDSEDGQANVRKARKLEEIAQELGIPLAQMAIAWCLKNLDVSTVILGATSIGQLEENLKSLEQVSRLTDEILERIEGVLDNRPELPVQF